MQLVIHVRSATTRVTPINESSYPYLSSDGRIELWRRWEDEDSFTQIHEVTDANIAPPPGGPNGWAAGYLLGWANAAYEEHTEWLIDEVTISTESLLDVEPPDDVENDAGPDPIDPHPVDSGPPEADAGTSVADAGSSSPDGRRAGDVDAASGCDVTGGALAAEALPFGLLAFVLRAFPAGRRRTRTREGKAKAVGSF